LGLPATSPEAPTPSFHLRHGLIRKGRRLQVGAAVRPLECRMIRALQEALSLLGGLMEKYPEESDEQIGRRFQQQIKHDPAFQYSIYKDVYRGLFQELTGRKTT
jgi:hypothetical protein